MPSQHLLDNAIKYNEDGGQIVIRAEREVAETVVILKITGPGVPEEDLPKVFDQFYRVEKSRSLDYGGSGLGLPIVKRIVELHKGKVDIKASRVQGRALSFDCQDIMRDNGY